MNRFCTAIADWIGRSNRYNFSGFSWGFNWWQRNWLIINQIGSVYQRCCWQYWSCCLTRQQGIDPFDAIFYRFDPVNVWSDSSDYSWHTANTTWWTENHNSNGCPRTVRVLEIYRASSVSLMIKLLIAFIKFCLHNLIWTVDYCYMANRWDCGSAAVAKGTHQWILYVISCVYVFTIGIIDNFRIDFKEFSHHFSILNPIIDKYQVVNKERIRIKISLKLIVTV